MKRTLRSSLLFFTVLALLLTLTAAAGVPMASAETASNGGSYYNAAAPNEAAIAQMLVKQGRLSSKATPEQAEAAVMAYSRQKLAQKPKSSTQVKNELLAAGAPAKALTSLTYNQKYGASKGSSVIEGSTDTPADVVDTAKLLVLLVEFGQDDKGDGPLHNMIPAPGAADNSTFWVKDFSKEHFQGMLFASGGYEAVDQNNQPLHLDSMTDYYLTQSNGMYEIDGVVYQWVTVPHSEAYYGDDNPNGGHDNQLPGTARDLVADAVAAADTAGLDFSPFDLENPYGLVAGSYYQPDGIVDHLVLVHAGVDQSGGGGAEGDNAIWAHSSSVSYGSLSADGKMIYNYVIQGENCAIGTFTHEYGHDLGLPDEYDTIYSGRGEPVGFWSLMSSGSWLGKPLDIKPSSISIWGRYALGWVTPQVIGLENKKVVLDQSVNYGKNEQALRINLPNKVLRYPAQPQSAPGMWYSGTGDEYAASIVSAGITLPAGASTLSYKTWYDIEEGWDFATVKISTDGTTWTNLISPRMTSEHDPDAYPTIIDDDLPGYTGSSGGWVPDSFDLSAYAGQTVYLKFLYQTDWGTALTGIFFDDMQIASGATVVWSDACDKADGWTADDFRISDGTFSSRHYYIAEWRQFAKTDATLKEVYSFINADTGTVDYFSFNPGLLLWYRNFAYTDNWVGDHPGYGFLGLVDANAQPLMTYGGTAVRTRIAIYDAAFSREPIKPQKVNILGNWYNLGAKSANTSFDDTKPYWYVSAPHAGLKLVNYGLKIAVTGTSMDKTAAQITVSVK